MSQKLRHAVNLEVETTLKVQRATVQQKIKAFQRYETLRELQQADQQIARTEQSQQNVEDIRPQVTAKQQKPLDKFRPACETLKEVPTFTKKLELTKPLPEPEDSSDIELDRKPVRPIVLKDQLEQMHNQIMMEREDRDFLIKQREVDELKTRTLRKDKDVRFRICRGFYDEILNQVIGAPQNSEIQAKFEEQKRVFEDDLFQFADCEVYKNYQDGCQSLWSCGKLLNGSDENTDAFNPSFKILEYLNSQLEGDVEFRLRLADKQKLLDQTAANKSVLQKLNYPNLILVGADEDLKIDSLQQFVSDNKNEVFCFDKIDETFTQQCKVEYGKYLESQKQIQTYFKNLKPQKNQALQVAQQTLNIKDQFMIWPVEPDKFNKALTANQVTPEQLLQARLNYVLYRKTGQMLPIFTEQSTVLAFMTSNKLPIDNLPQYFEIKFEDEQMFASSIFIVQNFKTMKHVTDFEVSLQFVVNNKLKLLQTNCPVEKKGKDDKKDRPQSNGAPKEPSDKPDPQEILQTFNAFKAAIDQQAKAKNAQIFKSVFDQVIFVIKPKSEKIDHKQLPKDVKKSVKLDDPELLLSEKDLFDIPFYADFQLVDVVDEFSGLSNLYKSADILLKQLVREDFENLINIDFSSIKLDPFKQTCQREHAQIIYEQLLSKVGDCLSGDLKIDTLIELLDEKQKLQFIFQLTQQLNNLLKSNQRNLIIKIQDSLKVMSLRSLKIRTTGLDRLIQNVLILTDELNTDLSENCIEILTKENPEAVRMRTIRQEQLQKSQQSEAILSVALTQKMNLTLEEKKHLRLTEKIGDRIERLSKPTKRRNKYEKPQVEQIVTAREYNKTRPIKVKEVKTRLISEFDNQMRTQLENQIHFFRQETADQLQEILNDTKFFTNILETYQVLEVCQLNEADEESCKKNWAEFRQTLSKYFDEQFLDDILVSSQEFNEVVITQLIQYLTELLFATSLPFVIYTYLKEAFKLGADEKAITEAFYKQDVTERYFLQHKYLTTPDIGQYMDDLYAKFGVFQQSKLLFSQIGKLTVILQNTVSNAQKRLVQQLEQLYLLLLQSVQQNSKQFKGVELLFGEIDRYRGAFEQELETLDGSYSSIRTELGRQSPDLSGVPALVQTYKCDQLIKELSPEVAAAIIEGYKQKCALDRLEECQKSPRFGETALKHAGLELQFVEQVPDAAPKAKKGATVPSFAYKYFYCPLLQQIKQRPFSVQEYKVLAAYLKGAVQIRLEPIKRPASAATAKAVKGKTQEVAELYSPAFVKFKETPQFALLSNIVVEEKIFQDKSLEFNRHFMLQFAQSAAEMPVEKSKVADFWYLWLLMLAYDSDKALFVEKCYFGLGFQEAPNKGLVRYQQNLLNMLQFNLFEPQYTAPKPEVTVNLINWLRYWLPAETLKTEIEELIVAEEAPPEQKTSKAGTPSRASGKRATSTKPDKKK